MTKKEKILKKIEGLVLVTEANRTYLKKLVLAMTDDAAMEKLDELVNQEELGIEITIQAMIKEEIEAGDTRILKVIDQALGKAFKSEQKAGKKQETLERNEDQEAAEKLLHHLP